MIVAPMFHAWGFSQLIFAASMACTIVTRRKFEPPEATLDLVDRHRATGLAVVPVMFDRIMDLPADVRNRYSGRSLRFAAASGSRMRPDVVIAFMDQFGDVIYNNYNATEAGMIATATPADLRAAPDTAGRPRAEPKSGSWTRISTRCRPARSAASTSATTPSSTAIPPAPRKDFHAGFMSSGDVGYLDEAGRLFVVGRDDEMIVSGGENVYPIEVEKTLASAPRGGRGRGDRGGRRAARPAAGRFRGARARMRRPPPTPSSNTFGRTLPTTRCRAKSRSSTSSPRHHRQDRARRTALTGEWLMVPRLWARRRLRLRAAPTADPRRGGISQCRQRITAAHRSSLRLGAEFWLGWPTSEVPEIYLTTSVLDAVRRGRRGDFAGPKGKAALAVTAAAWAILAVVRRRGVTTPGPRAGGGVARPARGPTTPRS